MLQALAPNAGNSSLLVKIPANQLREEDLHCSIKWVNELWKKREDCIYRYGAKHKLLTLHTHSTQRGESQNGIIDARADAKTRLSALVDIVTQHVEHQRIVYRQDLNKQASWSRTTNNLRTFAPFCVALLERITIPSYSYFEEQCIISSK
jgi:hypothetical protein